MQHVVLKLLLHFEVKSAFLLGSKDCYFETQRAHAIISDSLRGLGLMDWDVRYTLLQLKEKKRGDTLE